MIALFSVGDAYSQSKMDSHSVPQLRGVFQRLRQYTPGTGGAEADGILKILYLEEIRSAPE